jgi:hypothetical protein
MKISINLIMGFIFSKGLLNLNNNYVKNNQPFKGLG